VGDRQAHFGLGRTKVGEGKIGAGACSGVMSDKFLRYKYYGAEQGVPGCKEE
jgi:hypothetical protein